MEPAADKQLSTPNLATHLAAHKVSEAVAGALASPKTSAALPPKSPHSKPAKKIAPAEQVVTGGFRQKRKLDIPTDGPDASPLRAEQPLPHTPAQAAKRTKTGKTQSASPSGPAATPAEFLQKLADYIQEMGGKDLDPGWEVDVCLHLLNHDW
jgi:hypothetical protein